MIISYSCRRKWHYFHNIGLNYIESFDIGMGSLDMEISIMAIWTEKMILWILFIISESILIFDIEGVLPKQ